MGNSAPNAPHILATRRYRLLGCCYLSRRTLLKPLTLARVNSSSGTTALPSDAPDDDAGAGPAGGEDSAARSGATAGLGRQGARDAWLARRREEDGAGSTASARTAWAAHCTDMSLSLRRTSEHCH